MNGKHIIWAGALLVTIYTLQFLTARASLQGSITPSGLTVLRFYAAGALFIPYACMASTRHKLSQLGAARIIMLSFLVGFPYLLVINTGISLTSAGYVAAVGPGSIVLFSFLLPFIFLKDKPDLISITSTSLIALGVSAFIYNTFLVDGLSPLGTTLFVLQGFMFSLYGVLIKRWKVDPVLGTAVISIMSCLPAAISHATTNTGFESATTFEIAFQAFAQGILAGAAAIFLYTYIVQAIGPQRASLFMPSVPIITTVGGYYFLQEPLTMVQAFGLIVMAVGMATPGAIAIRQKNPAPSTSL